MYIFFEKIERRNSISYISNRYSKAYNKYLKYYDPKQESKHIIYLDANNIHGYAMSKFLLTSTFIWIDAKEFDLTKYTTSSSKGCVFEVDLKYPKELRELHYIVPSKKMLSEYQLRIDDLYKIPISNVRKLIPNFFDKEKYMIYYENLKLYLRLGLKLKKQNKNIPY